MPIETMATIETRTATSSIRISKIAGRYLIFDSDDAALVRREQNTCGTLVGTVPQQPSQNIFLGLPIELRPEEVQALVQRQAAHVVDDVAAHQTALRSDRSAYIESLRRRKQTAQKALAEKDARKAAELADKINRSKSAKKKKPKKEPSDEADDLAIFVNPQSEPNTSQNVLKGGISAITPTTSKELFTPETDSQHAISQVPEGPLARHLQGAGYYMTPGLRFGAMYSVYPGDPLRFHAHYMASQYDWDQEIPILDLCEGGRLATAVKKAFLVGGEEPSEGTSTGKPGMRTFSLEWAGM